MKKLCISDYDKLKFTSLKYGIDIIHFRYEDIDYTLKNGGTDYTQVTHLYKGRTKYNLEHISGTYGTSFNLIKYVGNKKTLKYIDKENFVFQLIGLGILEPSKEQSEKIKQREIDKRINKINQLKKEIEDLNNDKCI